MRHFSDEQFGAGLGEPHVSSGLVQPQPTVARRSRTMARKEKAEREAAARRSRNAGQCSLRVIHVVSAACGSCPLFPQSLHTARHTRRFAEWHDAGSFVSLTRKTNGMTKRESLMHLTPRHLDSVRSMAMGKSTIPELQESLTQNFDRYFPPFESGSATVFLQM